MSARPLIDLSDVGFVGMRYARPECVLATRSGDLFASDRRGGVLHRTPAGEERIYLGGSLDLSGPLHTNGFALDRDGSFIVAHLGDSEGGVFRLDRQGGLAPLLRKVDGIELTATNFVLLDTRGRLWITVCTRQVPRANAFNGHVSDGYIVLRDDRGARIVADGLGFANEVRLDAAGHWLYVNETYQRRVSRFRVSENGDLSSRETVATLKAGEFPDGMAFDAEGWLWITCLVANRVIRLSPSGERQTVIAETMPDYVAAVEDAYHRSRLATTHINETPTRTLKSVSSIAFGGADLTTVYLGVLAGRSLPVFTSPIAGQPMTHWTW